MSKPFAIAGLLKYVVGDATIPHASDNRLIIQINNDIGAYGAGFSGALSKRWSKVKNEYKRWHRSQEKFKLGEIQLIQVQSDTFVANMIAQHGIGHDEDGGPCIRYDALKECLEKVADFAFNNKLNVHAPRIGTNLAGGEWRAIEPLIIETLINRGINVTIYDLPANEVA